MTKIGFIGLGNMGGPMAANLAKAGHDVTATDLSIGAIDRAVAAGCRRGETVAATVADADIVVSMLPAGKHVRSVYTDDYGVIAHAKKGALFIDSSTIDVDTARAVGAAAAKAGFAMVDAPVSGGVGAATAGTLTFMVGGEAAALERAREALKDMGRNIFHAGPSGNGQAAKIANNMLLGVTMIATCEAFALGDRLGLDRQKMFDVVSTSSGQSWSMTSYCPAPGVGPTSPADNGYRPGFAAELMLKDLALSQMAATGADADTPMGELATELYRRFVEEEGGRGMDFSALLPRFEGRGRG